MNTAAVIVMLAVKAVIKENKNSLKPITYLMEKKCTLGESYPKVFYFLK